MGGGCFMEKVTHAAVLGLVVKVGLQGLCDGVQVPAAALEMLLQAPAGGVVHRCQINVLNYKNEFL